MTATQSLIQVQLGTPLKGYVHSRRRAGASWQSIADDLDERTGIAVSRESLRGWFPNAPMPKGGAA